MLYKEKNEGWVLTSFFFFFSSSLQVLWSSTSAHAGFKTCDTQLKENSSILVDEETGAQGV